MDKKDNYEKIEAYINGELSGEVLLAFEKQLKVDSALRNELALYQEVDEAFLEKEVIDFEKDILKTFKEADDELYGGGKTINENKTIRMFSIKRILSIAAVALILIVAGVGRYFLNTSTTSINYASLVEQQIIIPDYPTSILNPSNVRSQQDERLINAINTHWGEVLIAQQQNDFPKVNTTMELIEELDPKAANISLFEFNYLKGLTYLKVDDPQKAIDAFSKINIHDEQYGKKAYWFLALAKLLIPEKRTEAMDMIMIMADKENEYPQRERAIKLLKELKQDIK